MQDLLNRPMNRRRRTGMGAALAAAALMTLAACGGDDGGSASDGPRLINDGELVVAMSGEFQPFSYFDSNELTGFDYDIGAAIAEEMDLELKTETGAFDTLIQGVKSKRYDVLVASMTPTEERDNAVDFTDSYYTSGATMFVTDDSDCDGPDRDGLTQGRRRLRHDLPELPGGRGAGRRDRDLHLRRHGAPGRRRGPARRCDDRSTGRALPDRGDRP